MTELEINKDEIIKKCEKIIEYKKELEIKRRKGVDAPQEPKEEKQKLYMEFKEFSNGTNSMGCSENGYNPYYSLTETFDLNELKEMNEKELYNLIKLADKIAEGLY